MALPSLNSEGLTLTDGNTLASIKQIVDLVYPVGSLYWSGDPTDPSTLFKGTTWTQIKDVFILSEGDDKTFPVGQKSVKLTTENLPSHQHWFTPKGSMDSHTHPIPHTHTRGTMNITGNGGSSFGTPCTNAFKNWGSLGKLASGSYHHIYNWDFDASRNWSGSTSEPSIPNSGDPSSTGFTGSRTQTEATGGGTSINIIPPYIRKYCWQRES